MPNEALRKLKQGLLELDKACALEAAKALLEGIAQSEFGRRWRTARMDLWYYFAHRSLELLREEGLLSLIVSRYWTAGRGAARSARP